MWTHNKKKQSNGGVALGFEGVCFYLTTRAVFILFILVFLAKQKIVFHERNLLSICRLYVACMRM